MANTLIIFESSLLLQKRRPPSYFSSLRDTLHLMVENFHSTQNEVDGQAFNRKTLDEIEQILELHGLETAELIHQVIVSMIAKKRKE